MNDEIILITGSTDGIGKQTAIDLSKMGAHVIIHGRDKNRTQNTVYEIQDMTGNMHIDHFTADFTSMEDIRKMSKNIHDKYHHIDILINNAGIYSKDRILSKDGYEITFQVNHLAMFLLTNLLLDLIKKSSYKRIINVSSMVHSKNINLDNLQGEIKYDGYEAYSLSKLCNILFTYELAKVLKNSYITANCLHPGVIATKLLHAAWNYGGAPINEGSKTAVYLAIAEEVRDITGKYFVNKNQTKSADITYNKEIRKILWDLSMKYCNIDDTIK